MSTEESQEPEESQELEAFEALEELEELEELETLEELEESETSDEVDRLLEEATNTALHLHDSYEATIERLNLLQSRFQSPLLATIQQLHQDAMKQIAETGENPFLDRLLEVLP